MDGYVKKQDVIDAIDGMYEVTYFWDADTPEEEEDLEALVQNVIEQVVEAMVMKVEALQPKEQKRKGWRKWGTNRQKRTPGSLG